MHLSEDSHVPWDSDDSSSSSQREGRTRILPRDIVVTLRASVIRAPLTTSRSARHTIDIGTPFGADGGNSVHLFRE